MTRLYQSPKLGGLHVEQQGRTLLGNEYRQKTRHRPFPFQIDPFRLVRTSACPALPVAACVGPMKNSFLVGSGNIELLAQTRRRHCIGFPKWCIDNDVINMSGQEGQQ